MTKKKLIDEIGRAEAVCRIMDPDTDAAFPLPKGQNNRAAFCGALAARVHDLWGGNYTISVSDTHMEVRRAAVKLCSRTRPGWTSAAVL